MPLLRAARAQQGKPLPTSKVSRYSRLPQGNSGSRLLPLDVRTPQRIEASFAQIARDSIQAALVLQDTVTAQDRWLLAGAALKLKSTT